EVDEDGTRRPELRIELAIGRQAGHKGAGTGPASDHDAVVGVESDAVGDVVPGAEVEASDAVHAEGLVEDAVDVEAGDHGCPTRAACDHETDPGRRDHRPDLVVARSDIGSDGSAVPERRV